MVGRLDLPMALKQFLPERLALGFWGVGRLCLWAWTWEQKPPPVFKPNLPATTLGNAACSTCSQVFDQTKSGFQASLPSCQPSPVFRHQVHTCLPDIAASPSRPALCSRLPASKLFTVFQASTPLPAKDSNAHFPTTKPSHRSQTCHPANPGPRLLARNCKPIQHDYASKLQNIKMLTAFQTSSPLAMVAETEVHPCTLPCKLLASKALLQNTYCNLQALIQNLSATNASKTFAACKKQCQAPTSCSKLHLCIGTWQPARPQHCQVVMSAKNHGGCEKGSSFCHYCHCRHLTMQYLSTSSTSSSSTSPCSSSS